MINSILLFQIAGYIPPSLPISCLTTAPRFERPTQRPAIPGSSSSTKRPLVEHNPRGSPIPNRPKTSKGPGLNNSMEQGYEMSSHDIMELIQAMRNQLTETIQGKGPITKPMNIDGTFLF